MATIIHPAPIKEAHPNRVRGMTLVEVLVIIFILTITLVAIHSAQIAQLAMTEHSRNLSIAITDANRVLEELRRQNAFCTVPSAIPSFGQQSWNDWLNDTSASGGGGSGLPSSLNEIVAVTCRLADNSAFCPVDQIGSGEWQAPSSPIAGSPKGNPMQITISVCWSHRGRIVGECAWSDGNAPPLVPDDSLPYSSADTANVIDSSASITTLIICRSAP